MRKTRAAARSLAFFVLAPGVVAGLVPWWLTGWRVRQPLPYWAPLRVAGVVLLAGGAVVLVHAFVRFVFEGVGTPAPVAPTERLVVGGLYRYVRNPMYLAVAATIVGQALALGQPVLLLYTAAFGVAVVAFVHWYEEPTLRRQFGEHYEAYQRAVPAWWPRRRPPSTCSSSRSERALSETRVVATDEPARRRFRLYWRFVRPGSGLVRRSWLRAAKRRLERS